MLTRHIYILKKHVRIYIEYYLNDLLGELTAFGHNVFTKSYIVKCLFPKRKLEHKSSPDDSVMFIIKNINSVDMYFQCMEQ